MARLKEVPSIELAITTEEAALLYGLLGHTDSESPLGGLYDALDAYFGGEDKEYSRWHVDGPKILYGAQRG